jgi:hypothetical protein
MSLLPTATCSTAARTSSAKTAEAAASSKSTSTTAPTSATSTAPTEHVREKNPEQDAAQWCGENDQKNDNEDCDATDRESRLGSLHGSGRSTSLNIRELHTRVRGNDFSDPAGYKHQSLVVLAVLHQRDGFPLKSTDLAVRQNRFQAIPDLNPRAMILNCIKNQYASVGLLRTDAPSMEKIYCIALDVISIERINRDKRDLCSRFVVHLVAKVFYLGFSAGVENVREVVDVAGRLKLR